MSGRPLNHNRRKAGTDVNPRGFESKHGHHPETDWEQQDWERLGRPGHFVPRHKSTKATVKKIQSSWAKKVSAIWTQHEEEREFFFSFSVSSAEADWSRGTSALLYMSAIAA